MKHRENMTQTLERFAKYLQEEEKSKATMEKYLRDIRHFIKFADCREISK